MKRTMEEYEELKREIDKKNRLMFSKFNFILSKDIKYQAAIVLLLILFQLY